MTTSYARLTEAQLRELLAQKESPTLEYKREWYKIAKSYDQDTRERQSGELIKDILSLANGNADFAGETAYLIVGADEAGSDGNLRLYDIRDTLPLQKELQQKFKESCNPPLGHLYLDSHQIDGHQLYVIVIPPSPHLYEINREIKAEHRTFPEYTVFVRHGERVDIASTRERITLMQIKQGRFRDSRNAPSWLVGALTGALTGGSLGYGVGDKLNPDVTNLSQQQQKILGGIVGAGLNAFLGGMIGVITTFAKRNVIDWPRKPIWDKTLSWAPYIIGPVVVKLWNDLGKSRKAKSS
jgi:hypothetical protein